MTNQPPAPHTRPGSGQAPNQRSHDPTDPYLGTGEAFPQLTQAQVDRARTFGTVQSLAAGTTLFARGDRDVDFFLVLDGAIEIYQDGPDGQPDLLRVHGPRQFTGELALFNSQKVLVGARAAADSLVVRLTLPQLRRLMVAEVDIARTVFRAFILRRVSFIRDGRATALVIGPAAEADTIRVRRFLDGNNYPVTALDPDTQNRATYELLTQLGVRLPPQWPVVVYGTARPLENPSTRELADHLGLTQTLDPGAVFDLAVVGAGPAGLAAAVYGASEGLRTVVVESQAPGGQAGTSSMIENYLGFPVGISGQELAARAQLQAQRFGARILLPRTVKRVNCDSFPFTLQLDDGDTVHAKSIVIATGVRYRRLALASLPRFEGRGIHYAATPVEANLCTGEDTIVVGGANSAGQAAIFLSAHARHVHVVIRRGGLDATMSRYLQDRIEASRNISVHPHSEITGLYGQHHLSQIEWTNNQTRQATRRTVSNAFLMLGAVPNTAWVADCLETDTNGFICVGPDITDRGHYRPGSFPADLETSRPGVFAVGDVRSGSTQREASAVGEGSVVVSAVHRALATAPPPQRPPVQQS
jgi:thioredoxin reductase (NADPH)